MAFVQGAILGTATATYPGLDPLETVASRMTDLLLINPAAAHGLYGPLGDKLIAVEPPQWCRLVGGYIRDRGFSVKILDAEAEQLPPYAVVDVAKNLKPRLICLAVYGHQPSASTQQMWGAREVALALRRAAMGPVIIIGGHPSALPVRTLEEELVDYVGVGEGHTTILGLLQGGDEPWLLDCSRIPGLIWRDFEGNARTNAPAPLCEDLRELHGSVWDALPMHRYRAHNWHCFGTDPDRRQPYASIYTSLGCPYKCLAGDTLVDTIHGPLPIKEIAEEFGDVGVPIYTYDPIKRRVFIDQAVRVRRYGRNERLVRVRFDDGTHIDCTPDHKFLQFRWGNRKSLGSQWECEAKDLVSGAHVRAMRFELNPVHDRVIVTWGRRARQSRARMVMEYMEKRRLKKSEHVHHLDHDTTNDDPLNLELCANAKEHFARHPEIAERMRQDNPTKNGMSQEWRNNLAAANSGKVRSAESRHRYRNSKLGTKNPNYKHGKRVGARSRIAEVNHIVTSVEWLEDRRDVYCLTVPSTGWFFANHVAVKNCSFCCINSPFDSNRYRMRRPQDVADEIEFLLEEHGVRTLKITDEMFVLNQKHYTGICEELIQRGLGRKLNIWAYARVDTVVAKTLDLLRAAGIRWLALGIESGSKHVRDGARKALRTEDIVGTVRRIQSHGINVIGNFMFGLRDDAADSMQATLDLAIECKPDFANFYCTMAYPGSALYGEAIKKGWRLPPNWRSFSQHNDECFPLDTEHVRGREVLAFRDAAFSRFFTAPTYRDHVLNKFGLETLNSIDQMLGYKLKRKLLETA
jgi:radical SAM superfamily enzyme YgiQ (UPF0313 family)